MAILKGKLQLKIELQKMSIGEQVYHPIKLQTLASVVSKLRVKQGTSLCSETRKIAVKCPKPDRNIRQGSVAHSTGQDNVGQEQLNMCVCVC